MSEKDWIEWEFKIVALQLLLVDQYSEEKKQLEKQLLALSSLLEEKSE